VVLGGIAAVAVFFGGIFVYANFINDSPDELDGTDLSDALTGSTEAQVSDTTLALTPSDTTPTPETSPTSDGVDLDGDWIPTTASEFGYRVEEVLAGVNATAVGRSSEIEGLLTIDGTNASVVDIAVQIENITSDDSTRDGQFR